MLVRKLQRRCPVHHRLCCQQAVVIQATARRLLAVQVAALLTQARNERCATHLQRWYRAVHSKQVLAKLHAARSALEEANQKFQRMYDAAQARVDPELRRREELESRRRAQEQAKKAAEEKAKREADEYRAWRRSRTKTEVEERAKRGAEEEQECDQRIRRASRGNQEDEGVEHPKLEGI